MKAKDRVQPTTPPKIIRVPFLPKGTNVAELATSVWGVPKFTATEVDGVTNFVFSVPLRDKIRSHNRHLYRSLFESRGPVWTTALEDAYLSACSGKKTVAKYMDTLLYTVFQDALRLLMEDAKTLGPNYNDDFRPKFEQNVDDQAIDFKSKSHRKKGRRRGRQVDEARAIRLFQRYTTLKPPVITESRII